MATPIVRASPRKPRHPLPRGLVSTRCHRTRQVPSFKISKAGDSSAAALEPG